MPTTPAPRDQDDVEGLPPIDDDSTDAPHPTSAFDDDLGQDELESDAASLDDSSPADDPDGGDRGAGELEKGGESDGWLDEPTDNPGLDVGDAGLSQNVAGEVAPREQREDAEGEPPRASDEDFGKEEGGEGLDPAAEDGPVDADEPLRADDLPSLDADGEDDGPPDEPFARDQPFGLEWSSEPWPRVCAPAAVRAVVAIACAYRGALVATFTGDEGTEILRVDLEGTHETLAAEGLAKGPLRGIAVERGLGGERVAALLEGGRVHLSRDGGARFDALPDDVAAAEIALASGVLWARTQTGELLSARIAGVDIAGVAGAPAPVFERHGVVTPVVALAADGRGGIVALASGGAGRPTVLVRAGADGVVRQEKLDSPPPARAPFSLVAGRGQSAAVAGAGEVARQGADGRWSRASWEGEIAAIALVDAAGTLLVATYSRADDATALVLLDPAGVASVVARIGAAPDDVSEGGVAALAYDDERGVAWVAGGFGLAAFARRRSL